MMSNIASLTDERFGAELKKKLEKRDSVRLGGSISLKGG